MRLPHLLPLLLALTFANLHSQTAAAPAATPLPEPKLDWHDVTAWGVEGRGWVRAERQRGSIACPPPRREK